MIYTYLYINFRVFLVLDRLPAPHSFSNYPFKSAFGIKDLVKNISSIKIKLLFSKIGSFFISQNFERALKNRLENLYIYYTMSGLFLVLVGIGFSVLVKFQVPITGIQYITDDDMKSIVTIHAIIMLFFIILGLFFAIMFSVTHSKKNNIPLEIIFSLAYIYLFISILDLNYVYSIYMLFLVLSVIGIIPFIYKYYEYDYINYLDIAWKSYTILCNSIIDGLIMDSSIIHDYGLSYIHIILIFMGMATLLVNILFPRKESMPLLHKLRKFYLEFKKKPYLIIALFLVTIFVFVLISNTLGVVIIKNNFESLYITLFCRCIFIKLIISIILLIVSGDSYSWYYNISTDIKMPLSILVISYICYHFLPQISKLIDIITKNINYLAEDCFTK